ncbi:MAG TPA: OmpH family outer membrane protein [Bacteroidia bacterium]|nr:OmpH family outer membrane protein [Bacteroidia bacterium]
MKKLMKTVMVAFALITFATAANAQQKIAYIYTDSLLLVMPEKKKADTVIQETQVKWQKALAAKEEKIQSIADSLTRMMQRNKNTEPTGDPFYNLLKDDYQTEMQRYSQLEQQAQADLQKKQQEIYEPLYNKVKAAIAEVAKEKGYSYVIDASMGGLLYMPPADNLLADVKKKMNIK